MDFTVDGLLEAKKTMDAITDKYREQTALGFLEAGIHLIPDDDLKDNEFRVSRAMYEAARKLGDHLGRG
jgi:hypothetical protein